MSTRWTKDQYDDYIRRQKLSQNNNKQLRAPVQEQPKGMPLVSVKPSKKRAVRSTAGRIKITYRFFSMRPCDHDNYFAKYITDGLCKAGIIHGDAWNELCGEYISEKAMSKEEERTEIEISQLD